MNKYRNVKTVVNGIKFDSKAEAKRYSELKILAEIGQIIGLALQPRFRIEINKIKICDYVADFSYYDCSEGKSRITKRGLVVEDVKGIKTPVYNLKKKLMKAIHNIEIQEITK